MDERVDSDVVIVGAGPVGLTMAADLALRGVAVTVLEQRSAGEPPEVKCNHVSARSMESFRRLGIVRSIREAGLPPDHPHDVAFRTTLTGTELARIRIPCRRDRYTATAADDGGWPTPEPPHRINQTFLEPILAAHVASLPGVQIRYRSRYMSHLQDRDAVSVAFSDLRSQTVRRLSARFVIGCDGGRSAVRKEIGARLTGDPVVQRVQSTCIRAPDLLKTMPGEPAWGYYAVNPRRCGTVFAIDGRGLFLVHNHLNPDEPDFDNIDRDRSIRTILGVGERFTYDIVSHEDWVGRRLVADRFRAGRAFICGDAAHLWVPYAGYGMNAGIADALNLSWLIAAQLAGWAHSSMLDAYEAERHPITEQVSRFAMDHAQRAIAARRAVPANLEEEGSAGDEQRRELGTAYYELNLPQFCAAGLNFGYFYDRSPVIAYDGEAAPAYSMGTFAASTAPGCRAPHFWLDDGRSAYDAFGDGYTLIRLDPTADVDPLRFAARRVALPLTLLDVDTADLPPAYRHRLLICRADQHVAWRGDAVPDDPTVLVNHLRGAPTADARPGMDSQ